MPGAAEDLTGGDSSLLTPDWCDWTPVVVRADQPWCQHPTNQHAAIASYTTLKKQQKYLKHFPLELSDRGLEILENVSLFTQ